MKRAIVWLILLSMMAGTAAPVYAQEEEEARVIVATDEWTPPDLSGLTSADASELLLLKVAQEEIGYTEGPLSNETKYGEWFCGGRVAWCAEFITWCVDQVDQRYGTALMNDVFPWYGGPSTGAPFFIEKGRFISDNGKLPSNEKQWLIGSDHYLEADEYVPYPGDYIWFWYYSRSQGTDHVALVEGVSRDEDGTIQVHVIEGNNPDSVQRATYALTDWRVYGFGTPVKRAYSNLRIYNQNDDVAALQADLEALGYYVAEEGRDGVFTKEVQTAVKQLQHDGGVSATGIVDMETRRLLEAMLAEAGQAQ